MRLPFGLFVAEQLFNAGVEGPGQAKCQWEARVVFAPFEGNDCLAGNSQGGGELFL